MLHHRKSRAALPFLLAALMTLSSGCATAQASSEKTLGVDPKNPTHALIFVGVAGDEQTLTPEKAYIWIGAGAGKRTVWWFFLHKQATIKFKNKTNPAPINANPNPLLDGVVPCQELGKKRKAILCSLEIPDLPRGTYKYSVINGKDDDDNPLKDKDPEVEIDR
jgi:hypothetical protein